jgi:hypothetical protein
VFSEIKNGYNAEANAGYFAIIGLIDLFASDLFS